MKQMRTELQAPKEIKFIWELNDFYDFEANLSTIIIQLMEHLIERRKMFVSSDFTSFDDYKEKVLDKILKSFRLISENKLLKDDDKTIREGLDLFAKYFRYMWE